MKLSCVTASYVADLLGYPGHIDWGKAMQLILQAPMLETMEGMLKRLAPAKLDGLEIWFPHIWPDNLTPTLAGKINQMLAGYSMVCSATAGGVNNPEKEPLEAAALFHTTRLMEAPLIAGHLDASSIAALGQMAAKYGVYATYENGGETIAEILAAIPKGGAWVDATLDTGNLASRGGDPVAAVRQLSPHLRHVHFKDVPAVGSHDCLALGKGIVDVAGVIRELKAIGFDGWLSIEIETADHDPTDEIIASAETLRTLITQ